MQQVDHSLRSLGTDYIDLYWQHNWDRHTPLEETVSALNDLVCAGKVRYAGLSDTPAWAVARAATIAEFRGWTPVAAIQVEYSLLQRTPGQGDGAAPSASPRELRPTGVEPLRARRAGGGPVRKVPPGQHLTRSTFRPGVRSAGPAPDRQDIRPAVDALHRMSLPRRWQPSPWPGSGSKPR